ncbi:MAG: class I SAM-dependent methyltransferase [Candidatus Vecturithrix sp.]|jgi:SAM-dependent methyltransferase|nr:class I SAM-dependent methyltransferase [Candidatus Vecturithrix sp.]
MGEIKSEAERVTERYARRSAAGVEHRYSMLNPEVWKSVQERQRTLIKLLVRHTEKPLDQLRLLEIGCGSGGNLLEFLRLGFAPQNLVANELLPDRVNIVRKNLPTECELLEGDATTLNIRAGSFDIVFQSTVFSSLLDMDFQHQMAKRMWEWTKPGGGVLWYDFLYNNPRNPDVRGVSMRRIKRLFPQGKIDTNRVTLAPPISRTVCRIHPFFYTFLNTIPLLRTHVMCWIEKPKDEK